MRTVKTNIAPVNAMMLTHNLKSALLCILSPCCCRHLVVAKSMTRLANLLMQAPADPSAPQLAPHFASSAVAIAENALQVRGSVHNMCCVLGG
jgi:hypothetical protein